MLKQLPVPLAVGTLEVSSLGLFNTSATDVTYSLDFVGGLDCTF